MASTIIVLTVMCIAFCSCLLLTQSTIDDFCIKHLPGFKGKFPSKHYAGHISLDDDDDDKKLYYYFVESENKPSKDPVVLWLNGGPGCSSFDGFIYEHGPFHFKLREKKHHHDDDDLSKSVKGKKHRKHLTLHLNPHSWSKVCNIIYLDSPCGVGFSYSKKDSDYVTGDAKTASDTHRFLLKWFDLYEKFADNPFYIAGESYGGVFVPTLATEVVKGIDACVKPVINFKGYLVGNGKTDEEFDGNSLVPFVHGMGMISDDLYDQVHSDCKGKYFKTTNKNCSSKLAKIHQLLLDLNTNDVLEPCYHTPSKMATNDSKLPPSFRKLGETKKPMPVRKRMFGQAWPGQNSVGTIPCIDSEVANLWLNDKKVRKAIHAAEEAVSGKWDLCTSRINYTCDAGSMINIHKKLTARGYRALIYSGDHDMDFPFTGSEAWTKSLGYKVADEWRAWHVGGQVAGFTQGYQNNLTFLTIKGCGHTVAEYKPQESLEFFARWLTGQKI